MLKIAWSEIFAHSLPEGHRFPMAKYDLLPEQLLYEGTIAQENLFAPEPLAEQFILDTHDTEYWQRLSNLQLTASEIRKTGFPLSEQLVQREVVIMNGTVQASLFALEYGVGMNIAGGTHHAFTDRGEGFCLLNDIAIAANHLLKYKSINKVLVVDLDVHQGNGTAQIFENEPRVFTFSMHCGHNYPFHKEKSDLDVPLEAGTDDKTYLKLLNDYLPRLIDEVQPEFVFFQSGVDVLATDKLGKLGMSIDGCKARDRAVLELCRKNNLPVTVSMGGGYSQKIAHIVEAHANTFRLAQQLFF
ncbi:histone deacetylase family protein [Pontibacter mangrovi]|uniref:Histone deacetylase n=1 Tax=Pontibacter mangrovi TaxID=2589816 RepID=A0A501W7M9_9BACT|nr:histone deacetylase [Pontibacter mangrovi]TPE45318.1 histone deacetylase [Pontibacter mangrovi]